MALRAHPPDGGRASSQLPARRTLPVVSGSTSAPCDASDFGGTERVSELVLGIDIGTSSSKGVLARPDGEIVATAGQPHPLSLPRPGWAEHDALTTWWADFLILSRELVGCARELGGQIASLCV